MARSTIKAAARLISQAEADPWNDYRNLSRFLSFALKLRELAFTARIASPAGDAANRKIVRLLVGLVVDPATAEGRARTAEMPGFQRLSDLGTGPHDVVRLQDRRAMLMRRIVRIGDGALADARLLNTLALRLLDVYGVALNVEDHAFRLSLADQPGGEITSEQMHDWHIWARYNFFRDQGMSLGDILGSALRSRSFEQRVSDALDQLDRAA